MFFPRKTQANQKKTNAKPPLGPVFRTECGKDSWLPDFPINLPRSFRNSTSKKYRLPSITVTIRMGKRCSLLLYPPLTPAHTL